MKKKKILIIGIMVLVVISGCGKTSSKGKEISYDYNTYKVKVKIPEKSNYSFMEGTDPNYKVSYRNAEFSLIGEKVRIEFDESENDFVNSSLFINKYGSRQDNGYENYKKYMMDDEITHLKSKGIKEIKVEGKEGIQYKIDMNNDEIEDGYMRIMNTDEITKEYHINIYIFPKEENKRIEEIEKEEEVKMILESLEIEKK